MTESLVEKDGDYFGAVLGFEITVTWATLLLAEWLTAMKYYDVSTQIPAVISGVRRMRDIKPDASTKLKFIGGLANVAVSIWPGVLFAMTFYQKD